jgi:hypothetical protein
VVRKLPLFGEPRTRRRFSEQYHAASEKSLLDTGIIRRGRLCFDRSPKIGAICEGGGLKICRARRNGTRDSRVWLWQEGVAPSQPRHAATGQTFETMAEERASMPAREEEVA